MFKSLKFFHYITTSEWPRISQFMINFSFRGIISILRLILVFIKKNNFWFLKIVIMKLAIFSDNLNINRVKSNFSSYWKFDSKINFWKVSDHFYTIFTYWVRTNFGFRWKFLVKNRFLNFKTSDYEIRLFFVKTQYLLSYDRF